MMISGNKFGTKVGKNLKFQVSGFRFQVSGLKFQVEKFE